MRPLRNLTETELFELIGKGESTHLDFKVVCNAFDTAKPDAEKAKIELLKDICAMANNQDDPRDPGYLIIGVSDNGQDFASVTNSKFTDENIQTLCAGGLHPTPSIATRLMTIQSGVNAGKKIFLIQIGPHESGQFRFSRDYITSHGTEKHLAFHHRRNEMWVCSGTTSEVASPEFIARHPDLTKIALLAAGALGVTALFGTSILDKAPLPVRAGNDRGPRANKSKESGVFLSVTDVKIPSQETGQTFLLGKLQ
jgi:hypothetical protein